MNLIKKISLMTIFLVFGVNLMAHKPCPVGTCSSYSSLQTEQSLHGDLYMSTIGGMIIGLSGAALLTTTINYCFDRINLSQPQPPIANTPPLLYSALPDNNSAKVVASKMVQRYEENPALVKKLSQNPNNQLSFHGGIPISETWL